MIDIAPPTSNEQLVALCEAVLAEVSSVRQIALDTITACDGEQARLSHQSNHAAYVPGGMYVAHGFGARHILRAAGFYALDWREALERLDADVHGAADLLARLLLACDVDPTLEVAGYALLAKFDLLKHGALNPFWLRRPKLGLGQVVKAFGLKPADADAHRGLYALDLVVLRRGCERIAASQDDQRFGALLLPLVEAGGDRLAVIGAKAFQAEAQARYRQDCRQFGEHQRANASRRWRWKPPLSRQGHLAVTTARALSIPLPVARTRGYAANWLDIHDANLRFSKEDRA